MKKMVVLIRLQNRNIRNWELEITRWKLISIKLKK